MLRWGILGPGRIAPRIARALTDNPRGRLHAVASRDHERGRAFADRHGAAVVHGSYDALLADKDVDVVYIALPNGLHAEWTVRTLDAGKHVLCEKPFTANDETLLAAADALIGTARELMKTRQLHQVLHQVWAVT